MPVVQDAAHSPTGPPRRGPLRAPPLRGRPHPANDEPAARVNASRPPVAPDLLRLIPCPMGQGLLVIEHRAEIEDVEIPATAKIKLGHLRIWPPKANIALAGQRRSATMAATACCFCGRTVDQVTHLIQGPETASRCHLIAGLAVAFPASSPQTCGLVSSEVLGTRLRQPIQSSTKFWIKK
jgi:hypothetical protein